MHFTTASAVFNYLLDMNNCIMHEFLALSHTHWTTTTTTRRSISYHRRTISDYQKECESVINWLFVLVPQLALSPILISMICNQQQNNMCVIYVHVYTSAYTYALTRSLIYRMSKRGGMKREKLKVTFCKIGPKKIVQFFKKMKERESTKKSSEMRAHKN